MPTAHDVEIASVRARDGLPAGPRGVALARTVSQLVGNPLPALDALHERFGDAVGLRVPGTRMVILNHPDLVEELLVGRASVTGKGASVRRTTRLIGRNLFVLEGDEHLRRRRIASPIFRPRDLADHAAWTAGHAVEALEPWRDGEPVDVGAALDRMTVAALGHTLFGRSLAEQTDEVLALSHDATESMPWVVSPLSPLLGRLPLPGARRVDRTAQGLDDFIERHLLDGSADGAHLVAMLQRARDAEATADAPPLTHAELVQELRGFVLAGHDTTATLLGWVCQLLSQHPDIQAQVQDEVDALGTTEPMDSTRVVQLPYLRAVIDEVQRIVGGTFVLRDAQEDFELGPLRIRRGTELLCSMWTIHRDPRWWPDAERFDPDRFLDPDPDRPRYAHFPFGGGRHVCIGRHLALQSAIVAVAELARRWTLTPGGEPAQPVSNVLVRPDRPIVLTPHSRHA